MKLAVFGATGLTGGLVVARALDDGHEVTALVRDPRRVPLSHPRLTVIGGSPVAPSDVERCVRGADAVIHCLGIGGKGDGKPTSLISDSVLVTLAAMEQHGVPRIVCMSNVGAGGSGSWFANRIAIPLFVRWLRPIIEDKNRMEAGLRESAVEWCSVRRRATSHWMVVPMLRAFDVLSGFLASAERYRGMHIDAHDRVGQSDAVAEVHEEFHAWLDDLLLAVVQPRLDPGTDVALIADTAHIMFEGLLGSTIPRDRPFEEIVRFLIEMLVAAAPRAAQRRKRPARPAQ